MLLIVAAGAGGAALLAHRDAASRAEANPEALTVGFGGLGTAPSALAVRLDVPADPLRVRFDHPPAAALLFNVDTGEVLWRRRPNRVRPIASLTKMMTALLVVDNVPPWGRVRITPEAVHFKGSGVGLLPRGRLIPVETMLHGLLLVSGNDAAIALAQRVGDGSQRAFVRLMNERAQAMGLACTHYTTPSGIRDAGNHSCAADLAAIARAVLRQPRLRRIVRERSATLPFPDRGRQALPLQHQPAAARALPRHHRAEDRLHGRRRAMSGGDRTARDDAPGRRPAGLSGPGPPGGAAAGPRVHRQPLTPNDP